MKRAVSQPQMTCKGIIQHDLPALLDLGGETSPRKWPSVRNTLSKGSSMVRSLLPWLAVWCSQAASGNTTRAIITERCRPFQLKAKKNTAPVGSRRVPAASSRRLAKCRQRAPHQEKRQFGVAQYPARWPSIGSCARWAQNSVGK